MSAMRDFARSLDITPPTYIGPDIRRHHAPNAAACALSRIETCAKPSGAAEADCCGKTHFARRSYELETTRRGRYESTYDAHEGRSWGQSVARLLAVRHPNGLTMRASTTNVFDSCRKHTVASMLADGDANAHRDHEREKREIAQAALRYWKSEQRNVVANCNEFLADREATALARTCRLARIRWRGSTTASSSRGDARR
jgi:hypothetical protein